jgi:hypothetical protein
MWILYHGLMGSGWSSGQTLGRASQRITVADSEGRYLSSRDAIFRASLELLFILIPILLILDIVFLWWNEHASFHDWVCSSRVVRRRSESSQFHRVRGMNLALIVIVVFNCMQLYYETQAPYIAGSATNANVFLNELKEAANSGDPKSQYALGMVYFEGKEVPQNMKEAAKWFKLAADQGNARSQYQLAILHVSGNGVPKDFGKAFKLLKAAADGGDAEAQDALRKLASIH